jgi:glycosyltransferase involved in cell wall biosynthesis
VLVVTNDHQEPPENRIEGVDLLNITTGKKWLLGALRFSLKANIAIALNRVDVINHSSYRSAIFSFVTNRLGIPNVISVHGESGFTKPPRSRKGRLINYLKRLSIQNASALTAATEPLAANLERNYGREFIAIAHGAGPKKPPEPSYIKTLGLEKDGYILFTGRFSAEKGLDLLIDAYLMMTNPNRKLVVVGGSNSGKKYARDMRALARAEHADIIFTGYISDQEQLEEIQGNAYLSVSPMKIEEIPLTVLESMALGTPVLASDIDTRPLYGHTFQFKNNDVNSLHETLQTLMADNEQVEAIGRTGMDHVSMNYSWKSTAEDFMEIYSRIRS